MVLRPSGGAAVPERASKVVTIQYSATRLPATRQLGVFPLLAVTAALTLGTAFLVFEAGSHSGRAFAATLAAFAGLVLVMLLFAAAGMAERTAKIAGPGAGWLLAVLLLLFYLLYGTGSGTLSLPRIGAVALFLFLPLSLLAAAGPSGSGSWQDTLALTLVWTAVKFGPTHWVWPYPGGRLAYLLTVVLAVDLALAGFLLLRRVQGVGYQIGWGSGWGLYVL